MVEQKYGRIVAISSVSAKRGGGIFGGAHYSASKAGVLGLKYLSQTKHQYSPLPLAISEEFWKTLPKEYQDIIQEAANEARDYHRSLIKEDDEALVSELEKEGVIINAVPDIEPFRKAVEPVYAEFEDTFGRDLIEKLKNAAAEAR